MLPKITSIDQELAELGDEVRSADAEAGRAQASYEEARARSRLDQDAWEAAEQRLAESRVAAAGAAARVEALQAVVEGQADPQARARAIDRPEVTGPLLERLDVPPPMAAAVGAALGRWADAVAVGQAGSVDAVVEDLVAAALGGLAIVAPMAGSPVTTPTGAIPLTSRLGPTADQALARSVLGDVMLVGTWSQGWSLVTENPELRAVTLAGDLVTAAGVDLGSPRGRIAGSPRRGIRRRQGCRCGIGQSGEPAHLGAPRFRVGRHDERTALEALEGIETRLAGAAQASQRLEHAGAVRSEERQRLEQRLAAIATEEVDRQTTRSSHTAAVSTHSRAKRPTGWLHGRVLPR